MADIRSLIDRASSASTLEEETQVIWDALRLLMENCGDRDGLRLVVDAVGRGDMPRSVLLGVVAALVQEGAEYRIGSDSGVVLRASGFGYVVSKPEAATPALRLLIAILKTKEAFRG